MQNIGFSSQYGLENQGLRDLKNVYWNLGPAELVEQAILRQEGQLARTGSLIVYTGKHTGRSPSDKFIVKNDNKNDNIWWGNINQPISPDKFQVIFQKMIAYLRGRDVFVQDMRVGAHTAYQTSVRIISEKAWASLFAYNLFRRQPPEALSRFCPEYTLLHCPGFLTEPEQDTTSSSTVIAIDFAQKMIIVGGTSYAGEVKKAIFSVMNYLLPHRHILPMHCSANVGMHDDVALFFGLSGTGKTTLSSDPDRRLIGDDEHGWTDEGVFNFEGGCYAKTIRLSAKLEPLIWHAVNRFGAVLENVVVDPDTRLPDFDDSRITENTRAAYPLDFIPNHAVEGYAGHPRNIFFLTADAFGVMPPIAHLSPEQAMFYFLSGYTSKLAGTEKDLGSEPLATFSACFGAPFLPLHPQVYADLLGEKITRHQAEVWLVNTGWTGGPYGIGHRIHLPYTRAMVRAALTGNLESSHFYQEEAFGLWIPENCPEIPAEILNPVQTWTDPGAYRKQVQLLTDRFAQNYREMTGTTPRQATKAGPILV